MFDIFALVSNGSWDPVCLLGLLIFLESLGHKVISLIHVLQLSYCLTGNEVGTVTGVDNEINLEIDLSRQPQLRIINPTDDLLLNNLIKISLPKLQFPKQSNVVRFEYTCQFVDQIIKTIKSTDIIVIIELV